MRKQFIIRHSSSLLIRLLAFVVAFSGSLMVGPGVTPTVKAVAQTANLPAFTPTEQRRSNTTQSDIRNNTNY